MRQWYYTQKGRQRGPIPESEFLKLLGTGQFDSDTLVWSEGLQDWTPARDLDRKATSTDAPPPPTIQEPRTSPPPILAYAPSGKQVRPWVRYWARILDYLLFCFVAGIVLALVYEPALDLPDSFFGFALLFAYIFVEPVMLAAWGSTPGKALLRVRIRNRDGTKLSYPRALGRTAKVWVKGVGLGIPFVALFTQIYAYNRLKKEGITSWDEEGDFSVTHRVIGPWRVILIILIFILFFFIIALGNADV